jgi:hypothetical protein
MKKFIFLYLFILLSAFSCEKSNNENLTPQSNIVVKTGSSFGMCAGLCITEVVINSTQIAMERKAWRANVANQTCQRAITTQEWQTLTKAVDFDTFKALPEIIGCPDCADGGAEWIEIVYQEQAKKVTFEYGKEVPQIANLLAEVRKLRESLNNCE